MGKNLKCGDQAGSQGKEKEKKNCDCHLSNWSILAIPHNANTMDDTLAQVAEKCALQLEMYQKCVENYPDTWDKSCAQQKKALTKCSEEK